MASSVAPASAAAQNSYDDAGQSLERVDRLVGLIDDMDELKESIDLNTRVTADSIYLCGDQICQVSEQCGKGKKPTDCQDCGACL